MSFHIYMQHNASEPERLSKKLTNIIEMEGTLKNETSIIDPTLLVYGAMSNFVKVNYMYIPSFARYYYVTDIRSIKNNLFEIDGHVDVLMTYRSQIRKNKAVIRRSEKNYNLYLNDGSIKAQQNPKVQTKAFGSGFTTEKFILAIAGSD